MGFPPDRPGSYPTPHTQWMGMDSTQRFRQIIDAVDSPVFVIQVGDSGRFTYLDVNEAVAHATGLRREDFLGRAPEELPAHSGLQAAAFRANYERCLEAGETVRYRERLVVNGEEGWWLTRLTPVRDETGRITRIIGSSINATDRQRIKGIRIGGLIRDIGKITVPAEHPARPGALSEAEFLVIRAHPEVGYEIMKGVESPWPLSLMILQHHERLDGSGYPQGLEGDGILLEARILAVADVVEAMASHRPYRPALGLEPALKEIQAGRGIRFDTRVVDACIRLFRERDYRLD